MSNRAGVWGFVLVFICSIVVIDVVYIHHKAFGRSFLGSIGFSPPLDERKQQASNNGAAPYSVVSKKGEWTAADMEKVLAKAKEKTEGKKSDKVEQSKGETKAAKVDEKPKDGQEHKVAGLSCKAYGGPSDEHAAEMVYWEDIPSDAAFISPFKGNETKYLTFEPDEGGWNNMRMSMETAVAMALAMGRTLVMPPEFGMYLLMKNDQGQKNKFTFTDFFHFESVSVEHTALEIISFEEFLNREIMTGNVVNSTTGKPIFPPGNRTDWNKITRWEGFKLWPWMRDLGFASPWAFDTCMAGFTAKPSDVEAEKKMKQMARNITTSMPVQKRTQLFTDKPVPVDAPAFDRMREMMGPRRDVCVYDSNLQKEKIFHLMGDNDSGARLLVHFYVFLFFENWKHDLWTKRFIRDHMRYIDEMQCAAARVVHAMRQVSIKNGDGGQFDTFHIRRGDFQYKNTRISAEKIYQNTKDVLQENFTIYIATDERNKTFFEPLRKHYKIYFMDDFENVLEGVNTNYYGMLDQLISSRGRTFIGTFYSTFTGYISRIRGYHAQKDKSEGYELGWTNSYYYVPLEFKNHLRQYRPITGPMWGREFPIGWRDIDKGIGELSTTSR